MMEQLVDLGYDNLLNKAKSHKITVPDYSHDKENRLDSTAFPSMVKTYIYAIHPSES